MFTFVHVFHLRLFFILFPYVHFLSIFSYCYNFSHMLLSFMFIYFIFVRIYYILMYYYILYVILIVVHTWIILLFVHIRATLLIVCICHRSSNSSESSKFLGQITAYCHFYLLLAASPVQGEWKIPDKVSTEADAVEMKIVWKPPVIVSGGTELGQTTVTKLGPIVYVLFSRNSDRPEEGWELVDEVSTGCHSWTRPDFRCTVLISGSENRREIRQCLASTLSVSLELKRARRSRKISTWGPT